MRPLPKICTGKASHIAWEIVHLAGAQGRCILGDETRSRQRKIMRAYGVTFRNDPVAKAIEAASSTSSDEMEHGGSGMENEPGNESVDTSATAYPPAAHQNGVAATHA